MTFYQGQGHKIWSLNKNNKIIIIINFQCPVSNTRYHSIGLKVKEKQESNPGRQSDDRMGENSRGEA